jgi:hypothetical protein
MRTGAFDVTVMKRKNFLTLNFKETGVLVYGFCYKVSD